MRRCSRCGHAAISADQTVVATSLGATTRAWRRCPSRTRSGERRERGSALAGAKWGNHEGGVTLVKKCRRPLLVLT
jgi:hypothetical protein